MNQTPFPEFFEKSPIILGEGAVIERLRRNTDFEQILLSLIQHLFMTKKNVQLLRPYIGSTWTSAFSMICRFYYPPLPGGPVGSGSQPPVMKKGM